jgi:hypothetical protein
VDENTGHYPGGGVVAHHDDGIAALLKVRIEDRLARRRSDPAWVPWRIGDFPQIHQMIWYFNPLKYKAEMA